MTTQEIRFDDRVVVVSGAGRGMGRCHARLFAERGAHVVVNDCDEDVAKGVADEILSAGGSAIPAVADVVDESEAIVERALDEWGRVDVLVNNAGLAQNRCFGELGAEEFEHLLSVHLRGTVNLTRSAWPALQSAHGRIVNTSSGTIFGLAAAL